MERFSRSIDGGSSRSVGRHSKLEGRRKGWSHLLRTVRHDRSVRATRMKCWDLIFSGMSLRYEKGPRLVKL